MKPGPKEQRLAEMRALAVASMTDEEVEQAKKDPVLVDKATRAFLKHRAQSRDRMKRLRQKGKQS